LLCDVLLLSLNPIVLVKSFAVVFLLRRGKRIPRGCVLEGHVWYDVPWDQLLINWFAHRTGRHTHIYIYTFISFENNIYIYTFISVENIIFAMFEMFERICRIRKTWGIILFTLRSIKNAWYDQPEYKKGVSRAVEVTWIPNWSSN
jgi:hypothetical protein